MQALLSNKFYFRFVTAITVAAIASNCNAQRVKSPEVHGDGSVTIRHMAPKAESVTVQISRVPDGKIELQKGASGLWEGRSKALPPGIHEYSFNVDGNRQIDPLNRWVKKWYSLASLVEVPGEPALLSEKQMVPHGSMHSHTYASKVTGGDRSVLVYTPPGYENGRQDYPILFLLHGFGDDYLAWTEVGRANWIADNLLAQKKMKPMIIVMPYGHPEPLPYGKRQSDYGSRNDAKMEQDVMTEVLPLVEKYYRCKDSTDARGIVGLSMGGGHSLRIGLGNLDTFGWVGAFSAAAPSGDSLGKDFPGLKKNSKSLRKLWIACGDKDFLLERNQSFVAALKEAKIAHDYVETRGSHNWSVWRDDYLPKFLQLVFQENSSIY